MKKASLFVSVFAALFLCASVAGAQEGVKKIGFLDLSKLFDNYGKTKEYDATLESQHKAYEQELNGKIEKLKEAQGKLALLKAEEKDKMQKELEEMKADLTAFDQAKRTDLTKQRDEKIREILLEIEKVVSDYAKKEKFDLILNDRVLIYGNESMDVTDPVIKIMNESYNSGAKSSAGEVKK